MDLLTKVSKHYLEELPPSQETVEFYKSKLEKCRRDYDILLKCIDGLRSEMEDRCQLEGKIYSTEEKLRTVQGVLSQTQTLLLVERSNSQQLALHIDLLQKQHEMDREKLDLLLALNGKPVPNIFQGEIILKQQICKVEKLMKEQASQLMEERSLMKAEWDKEKRANENTYKNMKQRIRKLQEQLILTNENRVFYSQKQIQDFLNGKADFVMENHFELLNLDHCNENQHDKLDHCSSQELKRLKKKLDTLQQELELCQRKCISKTSTIQEIRDEFQKRQEKFQVQTKGMKEQVDKLREQNDQLNKRRQIEGAGFRNEIKILRDQLQRTQRQLCFLTVRKLEE